jgi:two-component system chemotaxis sensor kinase CheA
MSVTMAPGSRVEIVVSDDGKGVDIGRVRDAAIRAGFITADQAKTMASDEALELLFASGLSTSPIITDLSGRGLGLAIVREKIERLGGTVTAESRSGSGTTFRLVVPLTLATFRGVLVEVSGQTFVIQTVSVQRVLRLGPDDVRTVENRETICVDGHAVSLVGLADVLGLTGRSRGGGQRMAVLVGASGSRVAFRVDDVLGEQEITTKSLGTQLVHVRNVAAATVAGRGTVIPILDPADLVRSATSGSSMTSVTAPDTAKREGRRRVLVVEDSITSRTLLKNILEAAGFEVATAVDGLDGLTALRSGGFDLVISDVDMPRMNGFELTAKIRADRKIAELPVILVTALGSQQDREYGIEVGANAYIVKSSFDEGNLIEIARRLA